MQFWARSLCRVAWRGWKGKMVLVWLGFFLRRGARRAECLGRSGCRGSLGGRGIQGGWRLRGSNLGSASQRGGGVLLRRRCLASLRSRHRAARGGPGEVSLGIRLFGGSLLVWSRVGKISAAGWSPGWWRLQGGWGFARCRVSGSLRGGMCGCGRLGLYRFGLGLCCRRVRARAGGRRGECRRAA